MRQLKSGTGIVDSDGSSKELKGEILREELKCDIQKAREDHPVIDTPLNNWFIYQSKLNLSLPKK